MKRLIIEGDWTERQDQHGGPVDHSWVLTSPSGSRAFIYVNDSDLTLTVEDVVDPLPTEPGTVIEGTVEGRRNRLALVQHTTGGLEWIALIEDDLSARWFRSEDITDWTVLLPGVTE